MRHGWLAFPFDAILQPYLDLFRWPLQYFRQSFQIFFFRPEAMDSHGWVYSRRPVLRPTSKNPRHFPLFIPVRNCHSSIYHNLGPIHFVGMQLKWRKERWDFFCMRVDFTLAWRFRLGKVAALGSLFSDRFPMCSSSIVFSVMPFFVLFGPLFC